MTDTQAPPLTPQAQLIHDRMRELGLSAYAVANAAGVSRTFIVTVLRGRRNLTKPETIDKVAAVLRINPDRLYLAMERLPPDVTGAIVQHPQLLAVVRKLAAKLEGETE